MGPLGYLQVDTREQWEWQLGENEVGATTPTTVWCKIGLLGLLRDEPRRSWTVPNVPRRRLCTVVWLLDRDHLFTGKSEGCEGPFERDGTTRRSRGKEWHVVEVQVHPVNGLGTR
ncbi:hypothetical protein CRG98_008809 [Punica granatum]|uniref:Uncharacterized protein n=1 Tax=Punica granatum TaxID=22663 RepID=A0A2I0KQP1_PUNGR|nr:hypothetical protein CRG98_008809 [Punica granatum]